MAIRKKNKRRVSRKKSFQKRQQKWQQSSGLSVRARSRRKRGAGVNISIAAVVAGFLILGAIYILFYSPFFKVENVIVSGGVSVPEEDIQSVVNEQVLNQRSLLLFSAQNIFMLPSERAEKQVLDAFPSIYHVDVTKDFPNVLRVEVSERESAFIWQVESGGYVIADDGIAIGEASQIDIESREKPLIRSERNNAVELGQAVTNLRIIRFVEILEEKFQQKTEINVDEYVLPSAQAGEIHIMSEGGVKIMFSLESSADDQIDNLVLLIDQELNGSIAGLEYIDMRVGSWIYYK